jgi:hypothetical protein
LAGPILIGRNSASYTLALSNDYDTVTRNSLGAILGDYPIITASIYEGADKKTKSISLSKWPSEFGSSQIDPEYASYANNTLDIKKIPPDFVSGAFTFEWEGFTKDFSLKVVESNIDYNLIVEKTEIDDSTAGRFIVKVLRTDASGTRTLVSGEDDNTV